MLESDSQLVETPHWELQCVVFEHLPMIQDLKMVTEKQRTAARKNIKKAAAAAKKKRTIAHLPPKVRTELGKKGAAAAPKKRSK